MLVMKGLCEVRLTDLAIGDIRHGVVTDMLEFVHAFLALFVDVEEGVIDL